MTESISMVNSIDREDSDRVRELQCALDALGFRIAGEERESASAGRSTLQAVRSIERSAGLAIDERVVLSAAAAAEINRRLAGAGRIAGPAGGPAELLRVEGRVRGSDGVAFAGLQVRVFDRDLRDRQLLGTASTDRSGDYAVAYEAGQFARAEKGYADIVVQLLRPGADEPLYESEVLFNAPARLVHDIRLEMRGPSLYQRLIEAIEPLAEGQGVELAEIDETERFRDVSFLAGETGFAAFEVAALAVAARLTAQTGLDPRLLFALVLSGVWPEPAGTEPGAIRDLDARARALRARFGEPSMRAVRLALDTSVETGVVAATKAEIERFVRAFADLAGREGGSAPGAALPGTLLRQALGTDAAAIEGQLDKALDGASLVRSLRKDGQVSDRIVRKVEGLVALNTAAFGDQALVLGLADKVESADSVRLLARLDARQWSRLIKDAKAEPPPFVAEAGGKKADYAALLATRFRSLYPTQAFLGDAGRDRKAPQPLRDLAALIGDEPELDLANISIDRYLARSAGKRGPARGGRQPRRGTRAESLREMGESIKPLQRLYKISTDYSAVATLARHGLGSAQAVYRLGEDQAVRLLTDEAGLSERAAQLVFERAGATAAASLQLLVGVASETQVLDVPVMSGLADEAQTVPELGSLFAMGNDCVCADCSSVLSPAAYLADLLLFLSNRKLGDGRSAKDVLLARRPDLAWIDLNCPNAFTPLPYVDLAIEAMEDLVAPHSVGTLTAAQRTTLPSDSADHAVPAAVVAAFSAFAPPIALSAAARVRKAGSSWVLRDGESGFRILDSGAGPNVLVQRNTHGRPQDRELMPEYSNPHATAALNAKSFPWTLPLDLDGAETRLSLAKLGIRRDDLMRALRGPAAPNNPTPFELAAATIGISSALASVLVTPAPNPSAHWGVGSVAQAVAKYREVPTFLAVTGLSYADLLRLLSLPYANLNGALAIEHLDDSCDLAQKRLITLDAPSLDRLHRFLRLARALGLEAADTDLLIRRFGAGGALGNQQDLIAIADAMRVRSELGKLPVEELVALFGAIPTEDRFVEAHEPPAPSLYRRLFLDPLVHRPVDPAFEIPAVTAAAPAAQIAGHRSAILAALRIPSSDLDQLLPFAGQALSLANLSLLYRHARVARALDIPIAEWTLFARLVGGDPFASPAALLGAMETIAAARALEIDAALLSHLLEARLDVAGALPAEAAGAVLAGLRATLQAIAEQTQPPAPDSDRQTLIDRLPGAFAPLDPDSGRAALVAEMVENRFVARTEISPVPAALPVLDPSIAKLPFSAVVDGGKLVLSYTGAIGPAVKSLLNDPAKVGPVAGDVRWAPAIDALEQQPRLAVATVSTRFEAPLAAWPAGAALPAALKKRARYVAARRQLQFDGVMTAKERADLLAVSADPGWAAAVASLFDQPRATPVPAAQRLADFATWQFTDPTTDDEVAADAKVRANLVAMLAVLLPRARAAASREAVVTAMTAVVELDRDSIAAVLDRVSIAGATLMATLTDGPGFVATSGPVTPATLLPQFQAVDLLDRAARIAAQLRMGAREIDLVQTLAAAPNSDLLGFQALPLAYAGPPGPPPAPPALSPLARLVRLGTLLLLDRKTARKPVRLLDLMARILASPASVTLGPGPGTLDLFATAEESLGWPASEVGTLAAAGVGLGLAYPDDFRNAAAWRRLERALAVVRRTRLSAADALKLARAAPTAAEAATARQAMRVRLGQQYAEAGREVQDEMRALRRDGLRDFVLAYFQPGTGGRPPSPTGRWAKPTDVFAFLLIDPKMGACQMTSRIVQATIAIQTFVDRCFLGFEPEVSPTMAADGLWDHWKWMHAYRLWEANRKVFLFPENWVEPELRRDKSYAFKELEDELLQTELTEDSARDAFLNYIDKLDQVANLDVTGVHWQDGAGTGRGAVHVVGRTAGQEPHAYFYRRFDHPAERWTAWSKIELDLKSAPVVPFMYDRRAFLVWPEFREVKPSTEATISIPGSGGGSAAVERPRVACGVALSELRNGKWSPKKVSAQFLRPIDRDDYHERLAWTPVDLRRIAEDEHLYFQDIDARFYSSDGDCYEFLGCRGYPEPTRNYYYFVTVTFHNMELRAARDVEAQEVGPLIAFGTSTYGGGTPVLAATPDKVRITYPHHFNSFDLNNLQALQALNWLFGTSLTFDRGDKYVVAGTRAPWIFADKRHSFFVEPVTAFPDGRLLTGSSILDIWREWILSTPVFLQPFVRLFLEWLLWVDPFRRLRFSIFQHPMVCAFREALLEGGVPKLLSRPTQFLKGELDFDDRYAPVNGVVLRDNTAGDPVYHPVEDVDFSPRGAYSLYN
ncbi:MAG TPA: neuraminidase-like domain-containing protein, partial [Allosphingosinicella sp.]